MTTTAASAAATSARGRQPRSFIAIWWLTTVAGASVLLVAESLLLERKYGFFRGGYLATYQLDGVGAIAAFAATLLLSNAAIIGLMAAAWLFLASLARLAAPAAIWLAGVLATGPLVASTIVSYEIFRYLGDIDLSVMFGLVGRNVGEVIAVSGAHLLKPVGAMAVGVAATLAGAWWLNRRGPTGRAPLAYDRRVPLVAALVAVTGTIGHTGARLGDPVLDFGLARTTSGGIIGRMVHRVTDVDRDGFGLLQRPPDPDPWNARIHPWALEIPGNGIDENGIGGDLPADYAGYTEPAGTAPAFAWKPDVVLVLLETVRADAVGATLSGRSVTPALDAIAASGASSQAAYSHNGYTTQSRYHLFSGSLKGLRGRETLIDDFKTNGYEVIYISGQDDTFGGPRLQVGADRADVFFHAPHAPDRRFTRFSTPGSIGLPLSEVEARIAAAVAGRDTARPLFLYINFADTHFPYHHAAMRPLVDDAVVPQSQLTAANGDRIWRMYLNTIANVDAAIGRVLTRVSESSARQLGVVVTSDHGESLFDDGVLGHGFELSEVQTRIPFIVSGLPVQLGEPFGQVALRDAIWDALTRRAPHEPPRFTRSPDAQVIQYIGSLAKPAQFGLLGPDGRTVVDFMDGRVRVDPDPRWTRLGEAPAATRERADAAVHFWEAMRLAVDGARSADGEAP